MKYHTLQWFINRIGKRIYRNPLPCKCKECQRNYVDIVDMSKHNCRREFHAQYVYDSQNCLQIEYFNSEKELNQVLFEDKVCCLFDDGVGGRFELGANANEIVGHWHEDGHPYVITVPAQLRESLLSVLKNLNKMRIK